jgi:hypothetical protein
MTFNRFICRAIALLCFANPSVAAEKEVVWQDGRLDCDSRIRFDPSKFDETKLHATFDVVFVRDFSEQISPDVHLTREGLPEADLAGFRDMCARKIAAAKNLPLLNLPGIEKYRELRVEHMEDQCRFGEVEIRAHLGDPAALREYTPSVTSCARFIDALEGKTDLRAKWRDMIASTCRDNTKPDECERNFLSAQDRSNPTLRIKFDLLQYGWNNCSAAAPRSKADGEANRILTLLQKRFPKEVKVKPLRCTGID